MKIDVSSIKFDVGAVKTVNDDVKMDDLEMISRTIELPEPLHLDVQVTNLDDKYMVMGNLKADARLECNRCLEKFTYPMEMEFFQEFPKEEMINDNVLDLTDAIYEHLILELPIKTLCDEACKGLCTRCGQNLNLEDCGCDRLVVDPRLVKLKEFLKKD